MKHKHYWLAFAALAALTLVSLILSVCIGSVNIPLGDCVRILLGQDPGQYLCGHCAGAAAAPGPGGHSAGRYPGPVRLSAPNLFP